MLECTAIHYAVGATTIVRDVSLTVNAGEMVALCGPNGAGKTTLLTIASGERQPTTGSVMLRNTPLSKWASQDLAKARAKLSQESSLTFAFRVREVVEMGRFPHDSRVTNERVVQECMERVGIEDLADRLYTTLSGGEKQRVHMARVLAQLTEDEPAPKLLLLDEPTSALDLHHQEVALSVAHGLCREQNYGVLVVLHDLNLASAWADRVVLLKDGCVHAEGPPDAVLSEAVLQRVYGVDVLVLEHPTTGRPIVTIDRPGGSSITE